MNTIRKTVLGLALFAIGNANAEVITADVNALGLNNLGSPNSVSWNFSAPGGNALLKFGLVGYNSLDGWGFFYTDIFSLSVNGNTAFKGSFNLGGGGSDTILYNPNNATAIAMSNGFWLGGVADISLPISLQANGNQTITFIYDSPTFLSELGYLAGPQGVSDESWGVSWANVNTDPVPEPEEWAMMFIGVGMVAYQIKRKQRQANRQLI